MAAEGRRRLLGAVFAALLVTVVGTSLPGCSAEDLSTSYRQTAADATADEADSSNAPSGDSSASVPSASGEGEAGDSADVASRDQAASSRQTTYTTWDESESPNYVRLVGDAVIDEELEPGQVEYSSLDALGRTGQVRACITYQMMVDGEARERGSLPDPSGWPEQNREVEVQLPNGRTYHGWFWNRSHLLAKSLGGSDEVENLVTGTRMQNVGANDGQGGMDVFESAIRDWLEYRPDVTVQYVATPVYEGDELIPRSVIVDVLSSDGEIDEELEVYNACKGYAIDYDDGSFAPA